MPKSPPTQDLNQEPQPTDLYHHSLITTTPDALKYHAATSVQLQFGHNHENPTKPSTLLISSPYNEPAHLLDLTTLDQQSQLLAKALTAFQPTRADYATAAYTESFNWDAVFSFLRELCKVDGYVWAKREFFVVVFRSCIALNADVDRLHELDAKSHQEATASGGLLKYWFGSKNAERENLATCIWRNRDDAHRGGSGSWHRRARGAAREMYTRINFSMFALVIQDAVGSWEIRDWSDD